MKSDPLLLRSFLATGDDCNLTLNWISAASILTRHHHHRSGTTGYSDRRREGVDQSDDDEREGGTVRVAAKWVESPEFRPPPRQIKLQFIINLQPLQTSLAPVPTHEGKESSRYDALESPDREPPVATSVSCCKQEDLGFTQLQGSSITTKGERRLEEKRGGQEKDGLY